MLTRISVVVKNQSLADELSEALAELDASVQLHPLDGDFWEQAAAPADVLLVSIARLPTPAEESVRTLCELPGSPRLVVLTDQEVAESRQTLLNAGADGVLNFTLESSILTATLGKIIQRAREVIEERIQAELDQPQALLSDFASRSPVMQRFMGMVSRVSNADSSLLILGETGVGKERLARAIHEAGPRSDGPFVPVNCAAFPEALLEGELFGYEKGAFTGAVGDRRGYFELAHGGTLFLDEIGEVHKYVQVKLLRVLQERVIQRLGSEEETPINVRVMAATNRSLKDEIAAGRFRRDLFYRLSVVTLNVPSLRDHPEDIPPLLDRYLEEFRQSLGRAVEGYTDEALQVLIAYDWPGNIRELINVVERGVLLCSERVIDVDDLPSDMLTRTAAVPATATVVQSSVPPGWLPEGWRKLPWAQLRQLLVSKCEQEYIRYHLRETSGRVGMVAKRTGLSNRAVSMMMKRQGVKKEEFR